MNASRAAKVARLAWRWLRAPLVAYGCVVLYMVWFENSLIYFPSKYPAGDWQPVGLKFEDAWFAASDGTRLHGWYVPAEQPVAVVLFCHGNGGNLSHRRDLLQFMQQLIGATVLAFDYRGYGRSEGAPNRARKARWLAVAARGESVQHDEESKTPKTMGRSRGTSLHCPLLGRRMMEDG